MSRPLPYRTTLTHHNTIDPVLAVLGKFDVWPSSLSLRDKTVAGDIDRERFGGPYALQRPHVVLAVADSAPTDICVVQSNPLAAPILLLKPLVFGGCLYTEVPRCQVRLSQSTFTLLQKQSST